MNEEDEQSMEEDGESMEEDLEGEGSEEDGGLLFTVSLLTWYE